VMCPACHTANPGDTSNCLKCGTPLIPGPPSDSLTVTLRITDAPLRSGALFADRYEVIEELGHGGMGRVYRAVDKNLGRQVAIKILPPAFAQDEERMARFEREAKFLAALNHPNIAAIHGLEESEGRRFLVLELAEGETLQARLDRGPLPVEEALETCREVAEGLEAAHEKGIVHRDLKPGNIMLAPDGTVKILDFGLAKAYGAETTNADVATSPTITAQMTEPGVILGTAAYMSPEQARSRPVDKRTDVWSFGCVLYECLTGGKAFHGETVSDMLAEILKSEPDWSKLPAATPAGIQRLIRRCLQKDLRQRLQAIGDARIAIEEALSGDLEATTPQRLPARIETAIGQPQVSPLRRILPWALACLLAGALIAGLAVWKFALPASQPSMHFSAVTNFPGVQAQPALSPDGRSVAFVSNRDGPYEIYVGLISGGNLVKLTDDGNFKARPCWSPDGTEIAYARLNGSGIWDVWKVPALGGTPQRLILNALDPAWSPDGQTLAYTNSVTGALWTSDVSGQNARRVAAPGFPFERYAEPRFSPNGRELAFVTKWAGPYGYLRVVDLISGKLRHLPTGGGLALSPAWSQDGKFIYFASSRGGTMNVWKIAATGGEPEQITAGQGDDAQLDVSTDGKRIVFSTFRANMNIVQLDLVLKNGQQSLKPLTTDPARSQMAPAYSPDGRHLAYFSNLKGVEPEGVWLANADGSHPVPLVQDKQYANVFPHWTSDSNWLVYYSFKSSGGENRRISVSGGAPQTVVENDNGEAYFFDIGPGGRLLYRGANNQVLAFDLQSRKTQTLGTLPADEKCRVPRFSPDGRSVAYMVSPSGENDLNAGLWVTDFKNPPRQVYRGWVVWYARGPNHEIYLLQGKPDLGGILWKVGWDGKDLTRVLIPVPLAHSYYVRPGLNDTNMFDVSPDGQHLALSTESILQANIGMIENVR
jgi:Tol biopolymer transport system component